MTELQILKSDLKFPLKRLIVLSYGPVNTRFHSLNVLYIMLL